MTADDGITTTEEFKDALRLAKINCERSLENAPAPTDKNGKNTFKSNWKSDCLVEINHVVLLIRFENTLLITAAHANRLYRSLGCSNTLSVLIFARVLFSRIHFSSAARKLVPREN